MRSSNFALRHMAAALFAGVLCAGLSTAGHAQDLAHGEAVYMDWCAGCHAAGPGMPGTQALEVKYNGSLPAVLTERADLTPEFISAIVRSGISVMPPFRKTEISDEDLQALSAWIVATAPAAR